MRSRVVLVLCAVVLIHLSVTPAFAQRRLWGLTGSFTPVWQTVTFSSYLEGADEVALEGQAFRVGVSRGGKIQGDWSLLFIRRDLRSGGTIERDGVVYTTDDNVKLMGFEAEKFVVNKNIKNRVALGVVIAAGVAGANGTFTADNGSTIEAKHVLTAFGSEVKIQPLFRLEFGVGVVVARGTRIRMSGGFDLSGFSGTVAGTYFFGDR